MTYFENHFIMLNRSSRFPYPVPDPFGDIIGDKLAYSLPRILRGRLMGVFREVSGSISLQKSPVGSIDRAGTMKD
jgi:hypothetical protein